MNRRLSLTTVFVSVLCVAWTAAIASDEPAGSSAAVSLEQIMSDPDWIARSPETPLWSPDSGTIYFRRKRLGSEIRDWYRISADDHKISKVSLKDSISEIPSRGRFNKDFSRELTVRHGDLFLTDHNSGETQQLTQTSAVESSPMFLANEDRILFRRAGTTLIRDLNTGLESEPARILAEDAPRKEDAKSEKPGDQLRGFLTEKEQELFEYLRKQRLQEEEAKAQDEKQKQLTASDVPDAFYIGKDRKVVDTEFARNERFAAVVLTEAKAAVDGRNDRMPVWIRNDAYVENREVRELVGTEYEAPEELLILDLKRHSEFRVPLDQLPEITEDRLAALQSDLVSATPDEQPGETAGHGVGNGLVADESEKSDKGRQSEKRMKPRPVSILSVQFSADSKWLLFQCFSHDNKDRWVVVVDLSQFGKPEAVRTVHHRYDEAWIGNSEGFLSWLGRTSRICFVSESSGYAHLYAALPGKPEVQQLTEGSWEVSQVQISRDGSRIFFAGNENHPGEYELYSVNVKSGERTVHTALGGLNDFRISPDEAQAVSLHSTATAPPELWLIDIDDEADTEPARLTRTVTKEFRQIEWAEPEYVEIPSRHGAVIHARVYRPSGHSDEARPAVLFVHGAGYLQNAHKGWSSYYREFMFHTLLTQRGYVVLDMDYRASAGYGRDWRTAIYRRMGTPELEDLEDGVEWLVEHQQVDRGRIGVYGGSYGGFLTLMALFRKPDLFACGAALRPVTDWAHYNHGYTSNILNTPQTDPVAYEESSPIYYAEGLQKPLLICHGMVDDNVFFKDTVRLTQRLIELRKSDWNVAMYPVEPHGFRQPSSWYDEYRRILELFEENL